MTLWVIYASVGLFLFCVKISRNPWLNENIDWRAVKSKCHRELNNYSFVTIIGLKTTNLSLFIVRNQLEYCKFVHGLRNKETWID